MFDKISRKKITVVVIAGLLTVTCATTVFAADVPGHGRFGSQKQITQFNATKATSAIKSAVQSLVNAGTITQAQADAIIKVFPARAERFTNRGERKGFWDNLVTEGTITQAQADSIISAIKDGRAGQSAIKEVLESLVSKSIITQAQADAVQKACIPPERKNFEMKERKNPLAELVTAGTITQAQADAVNSAVKSAFDSLKK
jgi:competence protein ComGC